MLITIILFDNLFRLMWENAGSYSRVLSVFFFSLFQTDKYSSEIRENLSRTGRALEAFCMAENTGKNKGFPFLDILGYLKNTHKNPKFAKVRQVPTREFPTKFPDWDLSHSSKFGIFGGIL